MTCMTRATCRRWCPSRRRRGSAFTRGLQRTSCLPSAPRPRVLSGWHGVVHVEGSMVACSRVHARRQGKRAPAPTVPRVPGARSLSDAQKEVIVNGVIEVPTQGGDAVINQVRSAPLSRETLRRSPWSRVGGRRWTRVDPTLSCAGGPCAALSGSAVAHSQPPRDRASTATTST